MGISCDMNGKYCTLTKEIIVPIYFSGEDIKLIIPVGFKTDFASIPSGLHWLIPHLGDHNEAAVTHDYLYWKGKLGAVPLKQKEVDLIFLQEMKDADVVWWRSRAMYLGVRAGGWWTWWKYRRREKEASPGPV